MIRKRALIAALALLALPAWAGSAAASGFQTFEFSAAHVGQATAGMTMTENAAVVATLPAAMVRMEGKGGSLVGVTNYDPSYRGQVVGVPAAAGFSAETTTGSVAAPHAFYVHNAQTWAFGAGLYFPYNVVIEWPRDWYLDQAVEKEELNTQYIAFSGAYAINDELSIGGSLIHITAAARLERAQEVAPGVEALLVLDVEADQIGYNASLLWDTGTLAIGANYNAGYTLEGEGTLDVIGVFPAPLPATAMLNIPATLEVGFSYRSAAKDPDWLVELDLLHSAWSDFQQITIATTPPVANEAIVKNWDDTLGIKLGGNYVVSRSGNASHRVRAGIYVDESPIPADTLAPDVPDGKGRFEWALGYGLKSGGLIFDVAYFVVNFEDASTGPTNPITVGAGGAPTQFGGEVTIISASIGYSY